MKWLRKAIEGHGYIKVRSRLDRVDTNQTVAWANSTLWTIQEGLEHADDKAGLQQARTNTIALLAAVDSLLDRMA